MESKRYFYLMTSMLIFAIALQLLDTYSTLMISAHQFETNPMILYLTNKVGFDFAVIVVKVLSMLFAVSPFVLWSVSDRTFSKELFILYVSINFFYLIVVLNNFMHQ